MKDAGYEKINSFSIRICVCVLVCLSLSQLFVGSRAPDFQEKQQPSQKLLKPENTCSALWNLSTQTRIAGWEVPKLQRLGLVPMISFPCQLLHHVLYWLAYPGHNLASFSFSHKLQNFNPVSTKQVKQLKSGEKTKRKKLPGYNPTH